MAQYDFTVRALDETGAFADRTFNIEVQNNLVDQMAYLDGTHVYSSIDGINWTQRTGKGVGGAHIKYENGTWLVFDTNGNIKRYSKDCINWIEYSGFNITNLDSSFDGKLGGNINLHFYNMTTIGGWTYVFCPYFPIYAPNTEITTFERPLLRTKNFIDFEVVNYSGVTYSEYLDSGGNVLNPFCNGHAFSGFRAFSNIIDYNGFYYVMDSKKIYRSLDMSSWEFVSNVDKLTYSYRVNHMYNINGVIVITTLNTVVNGSNPYQEVVYSTDMFNWTDSYNAHSSPFTTSYNNDYGMYGNYVNGVFIMSGQYDDVLENSNPYQADYYTNFIGTVDLLNWFRIGYLGGSWGGNNLCGGIFQGKLVVINKASGYCEHLVAGKDIFTAVLSTTLPSTPISDPAFIK